MKAHEGRGLKNPEALKLRQKKIEELERKQAEGGLEAQGGLRVNTHGISILNLFCTGDVENHQRICRVNMKMHHDTEGVKHLSFS